MNSETALLEEIMDGALRDGFSKKCGRNFHAVGSERQFFAAIVTGIVTQDVSKGSFLQKLWRQVTQRDSEGQFIEKKSAGIVMQEGLRDSFSQKLCQDLSRSDL